ncbi:minor capsid protein [Neobacillus sp. PS3-40]|uniref:minor capsid protein n=1 Tax=Neobacillus sp. PS3-40 TaxID=3070679 RepID=UPI0027E0719D|nr:minor capsid protein [Neobacillus sp. PS3-40]WML44081.1 minor capsid protein [Neobacillus sp. PS3-40]
MDKFEEELLKMIDDIFNTTDKNHNEILEMYHKSQTNIISFFSFLFSEYGKDGQLDYAELEKYNRMQKVDDFLKEESKNMIKAEIAITTSILVAAYANTYYKSAYVMDKYMGNFEVGISYKLLKKEFINEIVNYNWSGIPFSQRIYKNHEFLIQTLKTELANGVRQGESVDKIATRVKNQMGIRYNQSRTLIRTESARVIASAQEKIYQDSGVVKELIYTATLDNKTTQFCRKHDGNRYKIDDPKRPSLPAHINCRSAWIPAVKDYQPKVRKDNENKQIIKYKNYEEWSKTKGIK